MTDHIFDDRRSLLRGMGALALLAPALTAMRAGAEPVSSLPPDQQAMLAAMPADARKVHEDLMALPDLQMHGDEQILMMLYPGFTALDLVGPYFFFASMMGATVHLVTTEPTLAPVKSDLGLAITPTVTMADAPAHADVLFIGGGTTGTLAAMQNPAVLAFIRRHHPVRPPSPAPRPRPASRSPLPLRSDGTPRAPPRWPQWPARPRREK